MKFSKKYILDTLGHALRQGTTPRKLALTCALGAVIGIFPVLGTTTLLCLAASVLFRLNIAIMQLVNYLVTALQVLLILPFIKTGICFFGLDTFDYSRDELITAFKNDFWALLKESGTSILAGIGIWFLVSLPLFIVLYFLSHYLFTRWKRSKMTSTGSSMP